MWFDENSIKENTYKFHLLFTIKGITIKGNNCATTASKKVKGSNSQKRLVVTNDFQLHYNKHVNKL